MLHKHIYPQHEPRCRLGLEEQWMPRSAQLREEAGSAASPAAISREMT